jgi:hypothetical protein
MTIFAILIAALMIFFTPVPIDFEASHLISIMLAGGTSVFLATIFLNTYILSPIQSMEQNLIPNLTELVRHDKPLRIGRLILLIFVLVSFLCVAIVSRIEDVKYQDWFFLGWLIFFGVTLDVFRDCWNRLVNILNPSFLVNAFSNGAMHAIQNDQNAQLLQNLDSLAEIGVRSVEKSKLALCTQTLQSFPPIIKTFLESSKSISSISRDIKEQQLGGGDIQSFMVFYLLQRLELINDKALRDRQETVCRQMIMTLGKMITSCAKFDLSMVAFPTHFLTKFGLKAQQHHFDEVTVLTTSTLLEVAKTILTDIDVTYAELIEPFRSIINGLDAIAKASFRKHKDTSIKVLIQPFLDLKKLFQTEKMANHRDTPEILKEIDRVIEEFSVLEQVLQTLPPLPGFETPPTPLPDQTPTV